jgi:hypothetical protein
MGRDTRFAHQEQRLCGEGLRPIPNTMGLAVTIGIAAAPIATGDRPYIGSLPWDASACYQNAA